MNSESWPFCLEDEFSVLELILPYFPQFQNKDIKLDHLEEAYTTEHWIVRIYKVKKPENVDPTPDGMSKDALRSTMAKARMQPLAVEPKIKYIGCYSGERFFSDDKEYHGSSAGANFNLIKHTAVVNKRRYFGIARAVNDGHG